MRQCFASCYIKYIFSERLHNANIQGKPWVLQDLLFDPYYRPQTKLREGYVFTGVCDSVHRGGSVYPSMHLGPPGWKTPPEWRTLPPRMESPPRMEKPPSPQVENPPPTVNVRAVRILLECILVIATLINKIGIGETPAIFIQFI